MSFQSADMGGISSRRLRYAVAASLLLHFLLLWPEPFRPPLREARTLLQATMRSPLQASEPPAPPHPRAAMSAPPVPHATSRPVPVPLESARPVPVPQVTATSSESAPRPASAAAVAETSTASGSSAAQPPAAAGGGLAAPVVSGEALDGLRGYRLAVASQARRFKRYPPEARASGWTGSTEVRLEVSADGLPLPALVSRSSGHEVLDRAALAMIDAGAQRARLPDSLRGRSFAVLLPVVFNLDEE